MTLNSVILIFLIFGPELQFGIVLVSVIYEIKFHLEAVILPHVMQSDLSILQLIKYNLCEMIGQT